jgi:hypothetical protein
LQGGKNKLGAAADHERRLQRLQEILDELVVLGPTGKSYEHASPRNLAPIFSLLLVLACSSHSLDPLSRSVPDCLQTSQVWKDSSSAASMRWRMASFA